MEVFKMNQLTYTVSIHAPDIPPKMRHQHILQQFDELKVQETLHLSNDHDPKPLYYQFLYEREGQFAWNYLEEGPDLWRVEIEKK
jgi:uncharacterized protein (DUF2249 family)